MNMLYSNRIHVSEGIDVYKTNESKACDMCHYWYFLDKGFRFQTYACNGWNDLLTMSLNLDNIAILNINSIDYHCNINGICKSEDVYLLQNADLTAKKWDIIKYNFFNYI